MPLGGLPPGGPPPGGTPPPVGSPPGPLFPAGALPSGLLGPSSPDPVGLCRSCCTLTAKFRMGLVSRLKVSTLADRSLQSAMCSPTLSMAAVAMG